MQLKDPTLFKQQCYINGKWVNASDKSVITVTNPATGETVGTAPSLGKTEVAQAIIPLAEPWRPGAT